MFLNTVLKVYVPAQVFVARQAKLFAKRTEGAAVSRNKCNSQLIFLSMLITKLGIPASETSLPLGV